MSFFKQFIPNDNQLAQKLIELQNDKTHVQIAQKCVNSCVSTYSIMELTPNNRLCVKDCLFEDLENRSLGKITK